MQTALLITAATFLLWFCLGALNSYIIPKTDFQSQSGILYEWHFCSSIFELQDYCCLFLNNKAKIIWNNVMIDKADQNQYTRKTANLLSTNMPLKLYVLFLEMTLLCDNNTNLRCTTFSR